MATKRNVPPDQIARLRDQVATGQHAANFLNNASVVFYMDKVRDKLIKRWIQLAIDDTTNKDLMHQMVKAVDMLRAEAVNDERRGREAAQTLSEV